jgi:pimeloyl-ACP methyl ester carboxylesterase
MATVKVNGVQLVYEFSGTGEVPLVLVHGSWVSRHNWDLVVPSLAESFQVLRYDRRRHSESERPTVQGSVREDVADLAALIEHFGLAPVWVAGNSFGGSITLRLATERPDLLRGIMVHEPPLFSLVNDDPTAAPMLEEAYGGVGAVVESIGSGDYAGAAKRFVDTVAIGPGSWAQLPPDLQQELIENVPTFLDEARDPEQLAIDLARIKAFSRPSLISKGDQSPPIFAPVIAKLADVLPKVEAVTFPGAGHTPHITHPDIYVEAITAFIRKNST